ncbi:MAG: phytanoyl-CoA dioxygenase [Inquilinus sp.]|nr:phytanoyl-CoA dioxygenase [Inquilinus sp.]
MAQLTPYQLSEFEDQGYLVVPGLFDPAREFAAVFRDYEAVLDGLLEDLRAVGEIPSTWRDLDFAERVIRLHRETGKIYHQYFDFAVPPRAGLPPDTPMCLSPAIFALISHPGLLDAVESAIGPEITSNPVQHVRIKPPQDALSFRSSGHLDDSLGVPTGTGLVGRTPWHQDNGVVTADADATDLLTVWFPLTDATVEQGCLAVIPGSHRGGLLTHCPDKVGELSIASRLIDEAQALPLPMAAGDVLFLHRRTCHSSLPNTSDTVRWSFDLRYHPTGQASGREWLPGCVVRSRSDPDSELHDAARWARAWVETRDTLARTSSLPPANRWSADAAECA